MTKLLELDVIETEKGINYPEIPENYGEGKFMQKYKCEKCDKIKKIIK